MSKKSPKTETDDGMRRLLRHAPGTLGGATGSGIGLGLGSIAIPGGEAIGAVIGSAAGNLLSGLGQDIWERHLSYREKQRLGTVLGVIVTEIHRRREAGENVRTDGFFDDNGTGRSDAAEIGESILLKVQREPEEKKIPYMGHLFSSIAFEPEFNLPYSHQLIKVAEQVTYRQLCIFKLADVKEKHELRDEFIHNQRKLGRNRYPVLYECVDLANKEYIYLGGETALGMGNAIPSQMSLQGIGADLFHLMRLCLIPDADIAPIAEQLK